MTSKIENFEASIDPRVTIEYAQPADYHFCQDSVILAEYVATKIATDHAMSNPESLKVLDLCAGCGVVGLELAHRTDRLKSVDFLEIQTIYRSFFETNRRAAGFREDQFRFVEQNYRTLILDEWRERYDLIIGNPPYFWPNEGKRSPKEIRNRSRFFLDADFGELILGVANALSPGGCAYLLVKNGRRHGRDTLTFIADLLALSRVVSDEAARIRGTSVVRLIKPSKTESRCFPDSSRTISGLN